MGRRRSWLAVGVPAVLLLGVLAAAGLRPAVDGCGGGPAAVLLPRPEQVPGLVGLDVVQAREAAEGAGVPWDDRQESWRVAGPPRGTVLAQAGGGCEDPLRLVLSTGGPLADVAEQAPAAQRALGPDPGPVRLVRLSDGLALQSDTVLTGECAAVERVRREEPVADDVTVGCYPSPVDALRGVVAAGSTFLGGPEPDPDDVRVLSSSSGAWLAETVPGWAADRSVDGWRLTVLVLSTRRVSEPACGVESAYQRCTAAQRADGTRVVSAQVQRPGAGGEAVVSRETVVQQGPWRVRVVLAPDAEGGPGPADPARPPTDLPGLTDLADAALTAVVPVSAP